MEPAPGRDAWLVEASWALAVSVALIALAWFPPLPIAGAQVSDAIGAGAVGLILVAVGARFGARGASGGAIADAFPSRAGAIAAAAYAAWALVSVLVMHGSKLRLLGTWWLVVLGLAVAALAHASDEAALRIRRAIVVAAVIGAIAGLVGALLYAMGTSTGLLNHWGDLVPGDYPRIRGTMMRANALAGLLATGLLLVGDMPRRWRVPIAVVLLAALAFTFSRTWIALVGAAAVYFLGVRPSIASSSAASTSTASTSTASTSTASSTASRLRPLVALAIVLACIGVMLAVSWLGIRLDPTRPWDITITEEPGTRLVHLRAALDTIAAHPLTGIGPGGHADVTGWDAHFTLANVAALMGIPAALALLALAVIAFQRAYAAARDGDTRARALVACFVLYGLDALARDIEDQRAFWIIIGLALALRRRA